MKRYRHSTARRLPGILAVLVYVTGGFGPTGGPVLAALTDGGGRPAAGACGCTEGDACCGTACCAPAEPAVSDCCAPADPGVPDCCASAATDIADCCAPTARSPVPAAAVTLALVSRCTCGQRDHAGVPCRALDHHLPAVVRVGTCLPPRTRLARIGPLVAAARHPEPPEAVPKPSRFPA